MDLSAEKRALRRAFVTRIRALDPLERARQESVLSGRFATLRGLSEARTVLLYVTAFPEEIDTGPMLRRALDLGKAVLCPRVDRAERRLRLYRVEDPGSDLEPGTLGIPEPRRRCPEVTPDAVDWVLTPGLGFDASGYRLGRGAGHYDRLLPLLRPGVLRCAFALDCQWVDALPVEPHDVPLDVIVSPGKVVVRHEWGAAGFVTTPKPGTADFRS